LILRHAILNTVAETLFAIAKHCNLKNQSVFGLIKYPYEAFEKVTKTLSIMTLSTAVSINDIYNAVPLY
jgi:hypothetical protein